MLLERVQRLLRKPERIKHCVINTSLRGEEVRINSTLTLTSVWNPIAQLGAQNTTNTIFLWKDRCYWRGSNRQTHQKGHPPRPPISSWSPSSTVSFLTNYLKWPSERFPAHTRPSPMNSALIRASLTFPPNWGQLTPSSSHKRSLVLISKCHCGPFTLGHEYPPSRKGRLWFF